MQLFSTFWVSCFAELFAEFIFYHYRIRQCLCCPGFWFCFLRGQCLSNKLSILLKISWNDSFGFPEGIWRVLFQSMFSISFSKTFGSKLWNDLFSFALCGWTPVSCPGTSRNGVRWSETEVAIFPEMILLEALL